MVDPHSGSHLLMAAPQTLAASSPPRRHRRSSTSPNSNPCRRSPAAAVFDVAVLAAVLLASGYLALPCFHLLYRALSAGFFAAARDLGAAPALLACVGAALLVLAVGLLVVIWCAVDGRKCDNPNCLGLRDAPEFDVQIETEEMCAKGAPGGGADGGMDGGFFELSGDHNRELESKLKKVAPVNGRAVLVFRARCGCSAGRMVVWGAKKGRKSKK